MKRLKLFAIGTSGILEEGAVDRIRLVNILCVVAAFVIFGTGLTLCIALHWRRDVFIPLAIEIPVNASVLLCKCLALPRTIRRQKS